MRTRSGLLGWVPAAAIVLGALGTLQADDAPQAAVLVEQAIDYHGGRAALVDWPHLQVDGDWEMSGRMAGRSVAFSLKQRADGAYRQEVVFEFRGRKIHAVEIFDRSIRKRRFRVGWDDLPLDEPVEEAAHRHPFLLEVAARDPRVRGEGSESDVAVWYVEVDDGRGKARLGLAKDDARVVTIEYPGTTAEGLGTREEVTKKVVYRDYRALGALRYPYDQEFFKDGTPDGRLRIEEAEAIAVFDPSWLEIPDPTDRFIPSEELAF